jgi:hypothetical protein
MSIKRSAASLDDDLEEDTDLPPPAPGLRSPVAEHVFDPPTLPGIVAPHRLAPLREPSPASETTPEPLHADALPAEPTLRMSTQALHEQLLAELVDPAPLAEQETAVALPPPPLLPSAATPVSEPEPSAPSGSRSFYTQSTQTLPEFAQLPPLPSAPEHDSLLAGLAYSRAVFRSLRKRRRLQDQLRINERADLDALDRVLVRLGQRAYSDHLDMIDWHPLFAGRLAEDPHEPTAPPDALLRRRAEIAAARLQALAQKELAALRKREALVESELRQRGQMLRRRYSELLALNRRSYGQPPGHPLHFQRQAAEITVAQALGEVDEVAQRLGQSRAERLLQERIYTHAQPSIDQLVVALSSKLAAAQRRPPHLQVLGALLATAGIGITPRGLGAASYAGIWQRMAELQTNLALRQTLFARLELDRQTYDREAITKTVLSLVVVGMALLCSAALVFWVVSAR